VQNCAVLDLLVANSKGVAVRELTRFSHVSDHLLVRGSPCRSAQFRPFTPASPTAATPQHLKLSNGLGRNTGRHICCGPEMIQPSIFIACCAIAVLWEIPSEGVFKILPHVTLRRALTNSDAMWPDSERSKHRGKPVGDDNVSALNLP
jgi:hypothetical protein